MEYFLRIILYKYIYKINFKIQIDTQIREIMAAGDEFPLDVILIIVAVIVVLFIAIFFGGRFISTRLRKREVLSARPRNVKNETGGRGEYRYTGGNGGGGSKDASSEDRDSIKKFIGESRDLLDLRDLDKRLAGVDTIHNMFRSSGIDVHDGPMKQFYMSDDPTEIDNSKAEFKKIIDNTQRVSDDNAKVIASMIDSVKIVLNSIKTCTFDVIIREDFLQNKIDKEILRNILKTLLDNEYNNRLADSDIKQFNKNLGFLVTLPNAIDEKQNVPNIVDQLIADRINTNSVIQNCGILNKDLDPMVRMHVDAGFYSEILDILSEENQIAAVLNNVFEKLQIDANSTVGLYMMMCKLGDKGRLKSYIANNPRITKDAEHTEDVAIDYIDAQIVAYPELNKLSQNFSAIKDDVETQLKSVVLTPQPGGANATSSGAPKKTVKLAKLDDYIKQQDVKQNMAYIIESYLKYVNICALANDQIRTNVFNTLFKFMPNIDEFREFAKDVLEKDNINTTQLSNDIVNKYNLKAQTVSGLYTTMRKYINDSIKSKIDALVADRTNTETTKAKFKELVKYAKNLTDLNVISGLIISSGGSREENIQLIISNRIWKSIDSGKPKIYEQYANAIDSTTPDNVTINTIFSDTDKDLKTISEVVKTTMTGDWLEVFGYLHKNRYNNTYIRSLMEYIGQVCDAGNIKNDIFTSDFVKDKLDKLGQKENNTNTAVLIDNTSAKKLKTDKLRDFMASLFINSDVFKTFRHNLLLVINELIKIITFIGGNKDNLSDYEAELADLSKVLKNINKLATENFASEVAGRINNFATNIIAEHKTQFSKFKQAKQQFDKLSALVTADPINDNYAAANKLFEDGIEKEQDSTKLATNLEDFKQFLEKQRMYDAAVSDIRDITGVLSATDQATAKTMITDADDYYMKFYDLLEKIHNITKIYHGTYTKILEELTKSLGSSAADASMVTKSDKMNQTYVLASTVSTASVQLSESLNLPNNTPGSKGHKLHTSITDIDTEISGHSVDIGNVKTNISGNIAAQVNAIVSDIDSKIAILRPNISAIERDRDQIYRNIANLLSDGLDQTEALKSTNYNKGLINTLQGSITALKQLDINDYKTITDTAASVGVDTKSISDKVTEYNGLITPIANLAEECTGKLFDDAIEKANNLAQQCEDTLDVSKGALPDLDTDPVGNIKAVFTLEDKYRDIVKYAEIAKLVGDNTNAKYTDLTTRYKTLLAEITKVVTPAKSRPTLMAKKISKNAGSTENALKTVNNTSPIIDINKIIKDIIQFKDVANAIFKTLSDINMDPDIATQLGLSALLASASNDMARIQNSMTNSDKLRDEVEALEAAAAITGTVASTKTTIAAADDNVKLKAAANTVLAELTKINNNYNKRYTETVARVKSSVELDVKKIVDEIPKITQYSNETESNMKFIETTVIKIDGVNDTESDSLINAITIVRADLATINSKTPPDANEFNALFDTEIKKVDQTAFKERIATDLATCNRIIQDIDNSSVYNSASNTELDAINSTNIPNLIAAENNIINELTTSTSANIKKDIIGVNNAAIINIQTISKNGNVGKVTAAAIAATNKLSVALSGNQGAIKKILDDVRNKLNGPLITVTSKGTRVNGKLISALQDIVNKMPKINNTNTNERTCAIEAYKKILNHVKEYLKNNSVIVTKSNTINTGVSDITTALAATPPDLVKVYSVYNLAKGLKDETELLNTECGKLDADIEILVNIIKLSDTIVQNNLAIYNDHVEAADIIKDAAAIITDCNTKRGNTAADLAKTQNRVNIITAKVSSLQDSNIYQALISVNNKLATLQQKDTDIQDKLAEADAENTQLATSLNIINTMLQSFKDDAQKLDDWIDEYSRNTSAPTDTVALTKRYVKNSNNLLKTMNILRVSNKRQSINRLIAEFDREKKNVNAALKQVIAMYQLIIDDDDDDVPAGTQPDDDKVKPFSQNSYDILPLDPKVATLSSNMQFSESKSTATNNPGNSFMYTIVPYDSKELSSDDRVLEIVSFARTQRMPIKDAANIIVKAGELLKKYRGTNKVIPGAWVYRGGKLFSSVKPTKIEELERYIELMRRSLTISDGFDRGSRSGGGMRKRE